MNSETVTRRLSWPCLLPALVLGAVFCFTVYLRAPWWGSPGKIDNAYFVTNELLYATNWYRDGVLALRGGMFACPRSVETPTLETRGLYSSYPPGAILPTYAISRILGREPSLDMIMGFDLLSHWSIALALSYSIFLLLRRLRWPDWAAFIWALVPGALELLLPSPLYQFQMRYTPDQPVVLWFAVFVFLEVARQEAGRTDVQRPIPRALLAVAQWIVGFLGIFTDWFFVFVALCVYLKRVWLRETGSGVTGFLRSGAAYWSSSAVALGLFGLQLYSFGGFDNLFYKSHLWTRAPLDTLFSIRAMNYFWHVHMVRGYGYVGIVLVLASLAATLFGLLYLLPQRFLRKKENQPLSQAVSLSFMFIMPCVLHLLALKTHSSFPAHYFSILKFSLPIATIPFVLAPVMCFFAWGRVPSGRKALIAPSIALLLAIGYIGLEAPRIVPQFDREKTDTEALAQARFIRANTGYEDIVFVGNPSMAMDERSPLLAFSMKEVHAAPSLQLAYRVAAPIEGDYVVNLFSKEGPSQSGADMERLRQTAFDHVAQNGLRLDKIHKRDFLAACAAAGAGAPAAKPKTPPKPWQGEMEMMRKLGELTTDIEQEKGVK